MCFTRVYYRFGWGRGATWPLGLVDRKFQLSSSSLSPSLRWSYEEGWLVKVSMCIYKASPCVLLEYKIFFGEGGVRHGSSNCWIENSNSHPRHFFQHSDDLYVKVYWLRWVCVYIKPLHVFYSSIKSFLVRERCDTAPRFGGSKIPTLILVAFSITQMIFPGKLVG